MSARTPDLSWIRSDLAIGGQFPMDAAPALSRAWGIGAVVDLRAEARDDPQRLRAAGLRFLHLPTPDEAGVSAPMLDAGVRFAAEVRQEGLGLLVHCRYGIGRSAILALCVLAERGVPPTEALLLVKEARDQVSPSEAQYGAWADWLRSKGWRDIPSYHEFGVVAYRPSARAKPRPDVDDAPPTEAGRCPAPR